MPDAHDLPRFAGRALIGDPRNDENSIVSQLQGLFHDSTTGWWTTIRASTSRTMQQRVRFHYQYVVLNDFLPRIVSAPVLRALKTGGHYDQRQAEVLPLAKRAIHAGGVLGGRLSPRPFDDPAGIPPERRRRHAAADLPGPDQGFPVGLTGFQTMAAGRAIDWGRFIDLDARDYGGDGQDAANKKRLQFAYRIDTSLVDPLGEPAARGGVQPASLAAAQSANAAGGSGCRPARRWPAPCISLRCTTPRS